MKMDGALMGPAKRDDWGTPPNILKLVREFFGGNIELDPCTSIDNPCAADRFFTKEENGLRATWEHSDKIYVNPPYGREISPWVEMCDIVAHRNSVDIIALLPARTDTIWWQRHAAWAARICFWRGRLRFVGATAPAPFPSAIVYWGARPIDFENIFDGYGRIMRGC